MKQAIPKCQTMKISRLINFIEDHGSQKLRIKEAKKFESLDANPENHKNTSIKKPKLLNETIENYLWKIKKAKEIESEC